ncbi:MAG: ABC transporter permease, partial [candidate division Zixibacteria bacterium]|nr:ABC transporter permease [candidate division Zixibacteria bacterium]
GYEEVLNQIKAYPEVAHASAFIEKEIMLRYKRRQDAVMIRGIDTEDISGVINVENLMKEGDFNLSSGENGVYGIILGSDIAVKFDISIGSTVFLSKPSFDMIGRPRIREYVVKGIFETGYSEFDNLFAFIDIYAAQDQMMFEGKISGIDIKLNDLQQATSFARKLSGDFSYPINYVRSWLDIHSMMFDWMKVQRLPILIAFGMIILVGSINLISTLILIILEKQRDIGILKSMGITSKSVLRIFFTIGGIVGMVAAVFGSVLALTLGWIQNTYQVISLSKDVYYIHDLVINMQWTSFVQIGLLAIVLCLLSTGYPAWKASKALPSESIRQL